MSGIADRLAGLGLELPAPPAAPPGVVLPFKWVRVSGDHAYVSGHGPLDGGDVLVRGKVGTDVSPEQGHHAARLTALSMLASLQQEVGDLDRVSGWVKALGLVNCAPGFSKTPAVINGFSDLIVEIWGAAGQHSRSAIGAAELPFDVPVEVEAIVGIA
jgi:enamine deaminase RidA (YjgF/YER057c/UK114 family)